MQGEVRHPPRRRPRGLLPAVALAAVLPGLALAQSPGPEAPPSAEPWRGGEPEPSPPVIAEAGERRLSFEPFVGFGGKSSTFTLSAKLGLRVDQVRLAWIWRAGFYDYQAHGYTETVKGPRADWLFWEAAGFDPVAGLFAGGGILAVTHEEDGVPDQRGWAAVAGFGVVLGPRRFIPPLAIGLDLQVPLTPGAGPTPVLLIEVSLSPLFILGAH